MSAVLVTGGGTGIGAAVAAWLLSDAASYVNGAVTPAGGNGLIDHAIDHSMAFLLI